MYQCEECDYASTHFHNMRRHKLKHVQNHQFKCPYCNYSSPRESGVKFHVNQYHSHARERGACASGGKCVHAYRALPRRS